MELALDDPRFKQQQQQNPYAINGPLAPRKPGMDEEFGNMVKQRAMEKSLNYGQNQLVKGVTSLSTPATAAVTAPQAAAMSSMTAGGAGLAPGAAQAILGSGTAAAPLVAQAAGTTGLAAGTTAAGTGAAMGAGMTALGTAMPYVGAAMLAGKALGFFNNGGMVGPLSEINYKQKGGDIDSSATAKFGPLGNMI
jgi:hypothetical protein|tara:strand:- start:1764 stop:2345 length:582 start_codon:yes stop_codon:yes gene_type:complete